MEGPIFSAVNFKLVGVCVLLLIIGYTFLGQGPVYNHISWSIAPIILVAVYCILMPITILYNKGKDNSDKKNKGV